MYVDSAWDPRRQDLDGIICWEALITGNSITHTISHSSQQRPLYLLVLGSSHDSAGTATLTSWFTNALLVDAVVEMNEVCAAYYPVWLPPWSSAITETPRMKFQTNTLLAGGIPQSLRALSVPPLAYVF